VLGDLWLLNRLRKRRRENQELRRQLAGGEPSPEDEERQLVRLTLVALVAVVIVIGLIVTGIKAIFHKEATVPNVERLDLGRAEARLKSAGIKYEEVGKSLLGPIAKGTWTVCKQEPAAGAKSDKVKLHYDRFCPSTVDESADPLLTQDAQREVRRIATSEESIFSAHLKPDAKVACEASGRKNLIDCVARGTSSRTNRSSSAPYCVKLVPQDQGGFTLTTYAATCDEHSGKRRAQTGSGKEVFVAQGCGGCHTLRAADATGALGPNLDQSLKGQSAGYIRESIVNPNAKIAAGYTRGVMPTNFGSSMSSSELERLVRFLAAATR
jgi:mono/diheme cytochrome c family protein